MGNQYGYKDKQKAQNESGMQFCQIYRQKDKIRQMESDDTRSNVIEIDCRTNAVCRLIDVI